MTPQPKERPILFSAPMVKAILGGRKTQTRRLVKTVGDAFWQHAGWKPVVNGGRIDKWVTGGRDGLSMGAGAPRPQCPYGSPGDRLWVREKWRLGEAYINAKLSDFHYPDEILLDHVHYAADDIPEHCTGQYRPSIYMPRWASRITLEVTGVRVERVQDISHHDAMQEGLIEWTDPPRVQSLHYGLSRADCWENTSPAAFARLWSTIHAADGPNGWKANPWVWVIEFQRLGVQSGSAAHSSTQQQ